MEQKAFFQTLSRFPMCSDNFHHGVVRLPASEALKRKHIQVNKPWLLDFLAFDIDRSGAVFAHEDKELPTPTYIMENPKNGHAHTLYQLEVPVVVGPRANLTPQRYFKDIDDAMTFQLAADPAYIKKFIKTPGHSAWRTTHTGKLFTLEELKEYITVDLDIAKATMKECRKSVVSDSRNLTLFNFLRAWAYQNVEKHKKEGSWSSFWDTARSEALTFCLGPIRSHFPSKGVLSEREQEAVIKSATRWTWRTYTGIGRLSDKEFGELQQIRAECRWGDSTEARKAAKRLYRKGLSKSQIARQLHVDRTTVYRWLT